MKVAVVDDSFMIQNAVRDAIYSSFPDAEVDTFCGLGYFDADDYDVLIVDNDGIGDSHFRNGVEFLKALDFDKNEKTVILFTGFCQGNDMKVLTAKGVRVAIKGGGCDEIVEIISESRRIK